MNDLIDDDTIRNLTVNYHKHLKELDAKNIELDDKVRELLNGVKAGQILEGTCNWCPAKPQKPT